MSDIRPTPKGNVHPNIAPYEVLSARDRGLAIAATSDLHFTRLCAVLDLESLVSDPRFATNADRVQNRLELLPLLESRLRMFDAEGWLGLLNDAGVAAALVNSADEILDDPDIQSTLVASLPDGVPQLRTPIRLDRMPLPLSSPPPRVGEHNDSIRACLATEWKESSE
jgi:crotonobetainyl-CoA:carnitine CoA-transferase CaiB-like acyl-CoA transferase